jgi:hypothetical protein
VPRHGEQIHPQHEQHEGQGRVSGRVDAAVGPRY